MVRYETLILTVPEITAHEASSIEGQIDGLVKKSNGSTLSFERWGKYRLAYSVWRNSYGVYFLVRFEVAADKAAALVKEIDTMLKVKYTQVVMRFMTTKLDSTLPLTYIKPESLEEAPSQDVDTFLRENKMKGILHTTSSHDVKHSQDEVEDLEMVND